MPLPLVSLPILCAYVNSSSKVQIICITDAPNTVLERTVFPGQRVLFATLPTAHLEIHTGMMANAVLEDTIPCDRLAMPVTKHLAA